MAHNMHIPRVTPSGSNVRRRRCWKTLMCAFALAHQPACLLAPPIEPEPPETNRSPFIDPDRILPADPFTVVTDSSQISVGATLLFDPNVETALYYAFVGQRGGQLKNSQSSLAVDQSELHRGLYVQYEGAEFIFNPCSAATRDAESETIFLYVSDRPFLEITPNQVTPAPDAFLVSQAWVFEITERACAF